MGRSRGQRAHRQLGTPEGREAAGPGSALLLSSPGSGVPLPRLPTTPKPCLHPSCEALAFKISATWERTRMRSGVPLPVSWHTAGWPGSLLGW